MKTSPQATVDAPQYAIPNWDARDRCLWVGEVLVKKFGALAPSQEFLLASLEREGWKTPLRIVSLPGKSKRTLQGRLHDAVMGLNRFATSRSNLLLSHRSQQRDRLGTDLHAQEKTEGCAELENDREASFF